MLDGEEDIDLVDQGTSGQEAIDLFRRHRPDITLMDLQMPGRGGIDAIAAIRSEFSNARFIVLTTYRGDIKALRALKAGASGYLLKNMLRKELLDTIRAVHAGHRGIPPEIAAGSRTTSDDGLSEKEIAMLQKVATGNSNKIVASQLNVGGVTLRAIRST